MNDNDLLNRMMMYLVAGWVLSFSLVAVKCHVSSARDDVRECVDSGKDMQTCKEVYGPW